MEGCSKYCSYCVVPYTRGEEVSRRFDDVLTEVAGLADQGVQGNHAARARTSTPTAARMGDDGEIADFALLIEYVAEIPGIERIRYTTSHPKEFTQRLIDAYAQGAASWSTTCTCRCSTARDRILVAMKRGYTALEYKSHRSASCARCARTSALSTDFIVGFPGETEDDFDAMMKLIDDVGFDNSFSFIFSPRPGTPAADLHDDTPHEVKLRAPAAAAGGDRGKRAAHQRSRWSARCSASWSKARRRKDAERTAGPHREQPRRQFRAGAARRALIGQMVDVAHHVAGAIRTRCAATLRRQTH